MEITFNESTGFDFLRHGIVGIFSSGEKTYKLYLSRGRNKKGERRYFVGGLGKRVSFSAETEAQAIEKGLSKIQKNQVKL